MNRDLRDVADPEAAQRDLEAENVFVEAWAYNPATRVMVIESPADPFVFEAAALRAGLSPSYLISGRALLRAKGAL